VAGDFETVRPSGDREVITSREVFGDALSALAPPQQRTTTSAAGHSSPMDSPNSLYAGVRGVVCYELHAEALQVAVLSYLRKNGKSVDTRGQAVVPTSTSSSGVEGGRSTTNHPNVDRKHEDLSTRQERRKKNAVTSLNDVHIVRVLGVGSFGRVKLVHHKSDATSLFAVKTIQKRLVMQANQQEQVALELRILTETQHPFVTALIGKFHDRNRLYLCMELELGGELCTLLDNCADETGAGLPLADVKFYATGIAMAISHIHEHGFVWRDVKPENVLIDSRGYPKACDFGISKHLEQDDCAYTVCGTVHYIAPEIVSQVGHSFPVDYWALGILVYECIKGLNPFTDDDSIIESYRRIAKRDIDLSVFPNETTASFLDALLQLSPTARLASHHHRQPGAAGATRVCEHSFFSDIDLDAYLRKAIPAPNLPETPTNWGKAFPEPEDGFVDSDASDWNEEFDFDEFNN
jgi:serine/threonine protein kinase